MIWITGLSDAGKTTLANEVAAQLHAKTLPVILLDGDQLRSVFGDSTKFDKISRIELGLKMARLCKILADQGHVVIIAIIGLFSEIHNWNYNNQRSFFLTYIDIPIDILKKRDSKGIYKKFEKRELTNVYGIDLEFEAPPIIDLHLRYETINGPEEDARKLILLAGKKFPNTQLGRLSTRID